MEDCLKKIEELEKKNLELQSQNQLQSEFIANISHELKTPLNSMIGFSSVLSKNKQNNLEEKQLKYISLINSNSKKLLKILENVIELNKINLSKETLHPKDINLEELIKETISNMQNQIDEKAMNVNFENNCSNTNYTIDTDKLNLVILHIISNAIKFSDMSTGIINISINEDNDNFILTISNNGSKIDDEIVNIFNDKEKYKELGVGLSVVKNTLNTIQASAIVENTHGTSFSIYLKKGLINE